MSDPAEQKFHLKYDSMTALYADQVVLSGANGAFILDFASSMVSDPGAHQATIPVHTRIAMTHQGAAQLLQLLSNAFAQGSASAPPGASPAQAAAPQPQVRPDQQQPSF
jgi:hypothetical protein